MTNNEQTITLNDAELDQVVGGNLRTDVHNLISDVRHPINEGRFFIVGDVKRTVKDILSFF